MLLVPSAVPRQRGDDQKFEAEYRKHKDGAVGVFVLGDLNVHSIRWLTHSARESTEGLLLTDVSNQLGCDNSSENRLVASISSIWYLQMCLIAQQSHARQWQITEAS